MSHPAFFGRPRRRLRRLACFARWTVTVCLLLSVCGCSAGGRSAPPPSAAEVLGRMQAAMRDTAQPLPDGLFYTRGVPPTDPSYLSDTLLSALLGEAAPPLTVDDGEPAPLGDVAVYLSGTAYPAELFVLRCSDARGTATAAKLCRTRLDILRRTYAATEWADLVERGTVAVQGSYVCLVVADDPQTVIRGAGVK